MTTVGILEVGPAVRTYGAEDVPLEQGDSRTLRMEAFHDIFEAVTGTFRFV
ncbi:hypothetical protein HFP71_15350 [Streptomyces sp. ARC32]